MKPVVFDKNAIDFTTLGLSRLPDAVSCTVTEELNGPFELEMVYPVTGLHYDEIAEDRIIAVPTQDGSTEKQAFRIYQISTPINGRVVISARHISYQMNFIPVIPFAGSTSAQTTLESLVAAAQETCPFSFNSDIVSASAYKLDLPTSMRMALGGMEGSILEHFGGEFEWNNWNVKLLSQRGTDRGVRITYGKNLTDITRTVDISETITGVAAYYSDGTNIVYSSPKVISNAHAGDYAFHRTLVLDVTGEFETKPTAAEVTAYATNFLASTAFAEVNEAVAVNFVALWQSPEYKDYAPLERVGLGDTVYIGYKQLGVSVKKRVTKTVYNVLLDRYDSIELGGQTTLSETVAGLSTGGDEIARTVAGIGSKTGIMAFAIAETGTFSIASQTSGTTTDKTITFTKTYSTAPHVLVIGANNSASVYGLPSITSTSTTDATVRLRNNANHSGTATFRWFALAEV